MSPTPNLFYSIRQVSSSIAHSFMAHSPLQGAKRSLRALLACLVALCAASPLSRAQERLSAADDSLSLDSSLSLDEGPDDSQFLSRDAAKFDEWEPLVEEPAEERLTDDCVKPELRPFDWMHHWGLRHSSRDGRFRDKSEPLAYSSWLNRPFHVDWFVGPLLGDDLTENTSQSNEIFGGLRAGWDFDYYWGLEWRFGWADPQISTEFSSDSTSAGYFVSDFDLIYYPWGDTRVRPYFQLGLGVSQVGTILEDGTDLDATLLSMPFGIGLQFPQTRWLAWRLEIVDNLAFGADQIDTMHNVAFTAGMELRFGARPNSYWPWRSSRTIW